jgi:transposase-like protein
MTKRRKRYSAQFKFGIALEAVKGLKIINQICREQSVHPNQISQWKKQLLEEGPTVFNSTSVRKPREQEAQEAVYSFIGDLVELQSGPTRLPKAPVRKGLFPQQRNVS